MKHAHTHTLTCEVQPSLTLKGHANTERLTQTAKCTHTHTTNDGPIVRKRKVIQYEVILYQASPRKPDGMATRIM